MSRQLTKLIILIVALAAASALLAACSEIQRTQPEPFYAETVPPPKHEFRWSNGKMPRSFDPARAAAAPETDVVRALFEGLTEIHTDTLEAVPAAAEKWSSSEEGRVWTFQLRKGARWSNGKRVTAYDFVTSWERLIALGEKTAHRELFQNIAGFQAARPIPTTELPDIVHAATPAVENQLKAQPANRTSAPKHEEVPVEPESNTAIKKPEAKKPTAKLGIEAVDDLTFQVSLITADPDFPKLVAHPIFRPVYGDGTEFAEDLLDNGVVTNGPFRVTLVDKNGISLDRSDTYWNKAAVKLEHVRFVAKDTAESALDAYKKGEIDALTNADFEPLVLKLLAPYDDFHQTTFSAVNLYKIDDSQPPYGDRRVREALALSIDRDRLSTTEMEGSADPAATFLPVNDSTEKLAYDPVRAKKLLESAGFPNGEGFAAIKLLINRNDTQMRIGRAVARMWKQNLNLDTEITVKETTEIDAAESSHEYNIIRRGIVLPTADQAVSLAAIFGTPKKQERMAGLQKDSVENGHLPEMKTGKVGGPSEPADKPVEKTQPAVLTEEDALFDLNAIPLYFPRSYSLVKPYVHGFEINSLDAVYLPGVSIESSWQPRAPERES